MDGPFRKSLVWNHIAWKTYSMAKRIEVLGAFLSKQEKIVVFIKWV